MNQAFQCPIRKIDVDVSIVPVHYIHHLPTKATPCQLVGGRLDPTMDTAELVHLLDGNTVRGAYPRDGAPLVDSVLDVTFLLTH